MTDDFDFYDLLGVEEDASQEEIRTGFRKQVREYHPDLNDDPRAPAQFSALKKAYDTLADPKERDAYDRLGHEEYVSNRISGLPSPDAWITGDDGAGDGSGDDGADVDDDGGGSTDDRAGTTSAGDATDAGGTTGRASERGGTASSSSGRTATESASRSGQRSRGGGPTQSGETGTTTAGDPGDRSVGRNGDRKSSASTGTDAAGRSRTGGTGAGTARGPGTAPGSDRERDDAADPAEADAATDDDRTSVGSRLWTGTETVLASVVGWPLILAADALFLVSLGLYAAGSAEGLGTLVDRLAAAGADPGAIGTALGTQPQGFESLSSFVAAELTASPVTGALVLVGMAFFPSVYFFMVRWTRKNRLPWQPSYLYVVGALSPIAALLASMLADVPGVYVEVVGFFLLPVVTIAAMLFFAQVKPRVARVYRRWRYRLGS